MKSILKNSILALALASTVTLANAHDGKDSIRTAQPLKENAKNTQIQRALPRSVVAEETPVLPQAKPRTLPAKSPYSPEQKAEIVGLTFESTR